MACCSISSTARYYRLARSVGGVRRLRRAHDGPPIPSRRPVAHGRVGLERRTTQINDVLADPTYGRQDAQRIAGFRTIMGAPMLLDDDVVGVLSVWRTEVDPFDDRADHAPHRVRRGGGHRGAQPRPRARPGGSRSAELARKVGQLEALGQLGEAVSSSLDLDTVLSTIVMHAVQLSGTDGGSLMEFDEAQQHFFVRTAYGTSDEVLRSAAEGRDLAARHASSAGRRWRGGRCRSPT